MSYFNIIFGFVYRYQSLFCVLSEPIFRFNMTFLTVSQHPLKITPFCFNPQKIKSLQFIFSLKIVHHICNWKMDAEYTGILSIFSISCHWSMERYVASLPLLMDLSLYYTLTVQFVPILLLCVIITINRCNCRWYS